MSITRKATIRVIVAIAALLLACRLHAQVTTKPTEPVKIGDKVTVTFTDGGKPRRITGILREINADYALIDSRGIRRLDTDEADWNRICNGKYPYRARPVFIGEEVTIEVFIRGVSRKVTGQLHRVTPDTAMIGSRVFHRQDIAKADWLWLSAAKPSLAPTSVGIEGYAVSFIVIAILAFPALLVVGRIFLLRHRRQAAESGTPDESDPWNRPDPDWGDDVSEAKMVDLSYNLAVLELCIEKLKEYIGRDEKHADAWQMKLKVANLMANQLRHRIDWDWEESFTDQDKAEILADHPLLQTDGGPPPDPAKQYAHKQWFHDIRTNVERFAATMRSRDSSTK